MQLYQRYLPCLREAADLPWSALHRGFQQHASHTALFLAHTDTHATVHPVSGRVLSQLNAS